MLLWTARTAALGTVGVALYLTLSPDPTGAGLLPPWAGHLGIFAGVGASFALLRHASGWAASRLNLLTLAVVALSATTEVGQSFTGRDPDLIDLTLDLTGGLSAMFASDALLARLRGRPARD
ncbi:MAG: hypothetical protein C4558_05930 [Dehalococcoidia bacterium]|nr:MAG: hypothetical protein C4558_05930 [Dehalococcoidia bacterium]